MSTMNFTVEETNLIAIYKASAKDKTLARIADAIPRMDDDMRIIAEGAIRKLNTLTEPEFSLLSFMPADETDGG